MARPWRIEYEGALYHVFSRGNNQQDIFVSDDDRYLFNNPLRAGIVKRLIDYRWSSYPAYLQIGDLFGLTHSSVSSGGKGSKLE